VVSHLARVDGAVVFEEVGLEEGLKNVARKFLEAILEGDNMHAFCVLDVGKLVHYHAVHADTHLQEELMVLPSHGVLLPPLDSRVMIYRVGGVD
jgi:hypothetical protein